MNDKLITYENLGRFYDDLNLNDLTDLDNRIKNLIKDTSTSNDSTWSSNKINTTKADKSYVDASLNNKADQTYVDAGLATKANIYQLATTAEIEALFSPTPPAPTAPADNEIWYTTESGELWEPYDMYGGGDTLQIDGNTLLSNTYENGHGVLRYTNNITSLDDGWGNSDYDHNTDLRSITLPHLITYIGQIMNYGNSDLNTINYNGTVAECSEIDMPYFMIYSDFDVREIVCLDGIYNPYE